MHVVAVVQARMGSLRLPGKVMLPLAGEPAIAHVLRRAAAVPSVDTVVLATSVDARDTPLADFVSSAGLARVVRGSEADPLDRYHQAAVETEADVIVRITGDCPLISPPHSERVVSRLLEADGTLSYVNNTSIRTLPRGLDTEAFLRAALDSAHTEGHRPDEREHVTPFIWSQPDRFPQACVFDEDDQSGHRWTLDTALDYDLLTRIFDALNPLDRDFGYRAILDLLEVHPAWVEINREVEQKKVLGAVV